MLFCSTAKNPTNATLLPIRVTRDRVAFSSQTALPDGHVSLFIVSQLLLHLERGVYLALLSHTGTHSDQGH